MSAYVRSGNESSSEKQALTPHQLRLIELLMDGHTILGAAALLHINERTARRWLKLKHVDAAYNAAKEDAYQKVLASLRRTSLAALKKHLEANVKPTAGSQMRAVQVVHDLDRIAELERLVTEYELRLRYPWHGGEERIEDDE